MDEVKFEDIESYLGKNLVGGRDLRFVVAIDGWRFPVLLNVSKRFPDRLLVLYNGAVDRSRSKTGVVFQRSKWFGEFHASRIHIADPTLLLHRDLTLGWGQLDRDQWGIPLYVKIIESLRLVATLPNSDATLHYGSSAGGHQAIMTSCLDRGSRAFANNPQTDVTAYWPGLQKPMFLKVFDDDERGTSAVAEFPWRFKCADLFRKEKYVPGMRIATNINSSQDYDLQFLPFIQELPSIQPSSSRLLLEPYWDPKGGHSALDRGPTVKRVNAELSALDI